MNNYDEIIQQQSENKTLKTVSSPMFIKVALIAIAVLIVWFYVLKPIFEKLGLKKTAEQNKLDNMYSNALVSDFTRQYNTQRPTQTDSFLASLAEIIYESLRYSALDDDDSQAINAICKVQNLSDLYKVIQFFGKRQEHFLGIPTGSPKDLPTFLTTNLSTREISKINKYLTSKGINYQF